MEALYIEDNLIEQRLMTLYMGDLGVKLHIAGTGSEGWTMAHKVLPSFIMMDMGMPDMDGETLLKLLKADYRVRHIPLIVITADLLIDRKVNIWDMGVVGCVIKPVSKSRLAGLLKQLFP